MAEPSIAAQLADLLPADSAADSPADSPASSLSEPDQRHNVRENVRETLRQCEPGQVMPARHRGRDVALFVVADGRAFIAPDVCPHDGGRLSDGFVDGDQLVCSRHGWEFDAESGICPQFNGGNGGVCIHTRAVARTPKRKPQRATMSSRPLPIE